MRSDQLFYQGLNTDYRVIKKGSTAKNVANGIVDIAIIVASATNVYVAFLDSGISLLRAFNNMSGTAWATG